MRRVAEARDEEAFTTLVNRYRDELIRHGVRMIGDYHRSEELAQEAFVRVYRQASSFDPARAFRSWVFTIAANLCRSELRRMANRPRPDDAKTEAVAATATIEDNTEDIRRAVAKLAEHEREALILREYHGFRYAEIAAVMNVPVNTVRTWIHRARKRLLELLGEGSAK